jgi:VCBS repeat-containing protein
MARLVGVVSKVIGQVFAVDDDGHRRVLVEGDRLYAGEQLETGSTGAVAVRLHNGAELTLGRDSSLEMTPDLLANRAPHVHAPDAVPSEAQLSDVEQLQRAIAAGSDPTQDAEATAAGPNPGGNGALGGGHSFVLLTEVAGRVDPSIGFPTAGFNNVPELARDYLGERSNDSNPGTFTPTPPDHPVTLEGLNVEPGELTLDEANLPQGSVNDQSQLTQHGSFTVVAPDGVFNLSVGGINVVTAGVVTGVGQSITTALGNTLTITGYNPGTGVVSYSYTLTGADQHADGAGNNVLSEHFPVLVSDTDGDVASGSLDVNIIDDVPKAVDDHNATPATELHTELTGNVLDNDTQGADRVPGGMVQGGSFTGTYGTLLLNADGSYTYTLDTSDPDFKQLLGGGTGVEHFTYTIKDADGDTSTATLTLDVKNLDDPVKLCGLDVEGGEVTVYEKHLGDGSAPNTGALTQGGTFTVSAPDGLQTLTVGGIAVVSGGVAAGFPQSVTTPLGNTLTITGYNPDTGVISYTYQLLDNETHANGDGTNSLSEHFTVTATDRDGSTASGSLDVNIIDDVPKAVDDHNATPATELHTELTGNVLDNDTQGADRVPGGMVQGGSFTGTYGTLLLSADGSYTYTLDTSDPDFKQLLGGGTGVEHFTYTIKDADGDTSTATLTLDVKNLDDPVKLCGLDVEGGEVTVYEKHLGDGSAPNTGALTQGGTFTVSAPDGLQTLTVGGIAVVSGGVAAGFPQSVTTPLGNTLTITGYNPDTGVISYTYQLLDNETHANGDGTNSLSEHFTVTATDRDGSTASGSLDVNIIDDVPKAVDDHNATPATELHTELTGNVLDNDTQGADRVPGGMVQGGSFTGTYGTLLLNADGSYTYTLDTSDPDFKQLLGGGTGVEHFTYTIKDADGDTSTATLTLDIKNLDDPVKLCGLDVEGGEIKVYEKNLCDGSAPTPADLTQGGTFIVNAPDGLKTLVVGGIILVNDGVAAGFPQSVTTPLGNTLTITGYNPDTGVVSYTYQLLDNETHANGDGTNSLVEHFTVTATDLDGSTASGSLDVSIVDDVPKAHCDFADVTEGGSVSGNVLANDVIGADVRADGQYVVGVRAGGDTSTSAIGHVGEQINGVYGYLILDADGNGTYHANANQPLPQWASDTFVYTIRDADGDESTATITINVQDCKLVAGEDDVTVYEKALDLCKTGSDLAPGTVVGSDPHSSAETASGSVADAVSGGVGALTFSLVGNAMGQYGQILLNADGSYTYTLTSAPNSPTHANDGANVVSESFTYQVKDSLGNTTTSTIVINIVDDVPQAHCDYADVSQGGSVSGNVLANDVIGADVRADGQYVVGVRAGHDTSTSAIGHVGEQITGLYGYLTLDAQGNATYHANANSVLPPWAYDSFVYTIRDADGDESTTVVQINVQDCKLVAGVDSDVTVYEKALDLCKTGSDLAPGTVVGSDPHSSAETASGSVADAVSGGVGALTFSLVGNATGQYGQILLNADGSYTYTLTSAPNSPTHANDGANVVSESFTYQVKDSLGNTTTSTIVINIVDDVPQAHCDYADVSQGGSVSGNVLANDVIGADVRADGQYVVGVRAGGDTSTSAIGHVGEQVIGQYGYLVLDAQGMGTYHAYSNHHLPAWASDTFVYTIRDADGDESTTTITLNVKDGKPADCDDQGRGPGQQAQSHHDVGAASQAQMIRFDAPDNKAANQYRDLARSEFTGLAGSMTAALVVAGYLGAVGGANAEDRFTVTLHKGETLTLDHDRPAGNLVLAWKDAGGNYQTLADGGSFTASHDGQYSIRVTHAADSVGGSKAAENYKLNLAMDYSQAGKVLEDTGHDEHRDDAQAGYGGQHLADDAARHGSSQPHPSASEHPVHSADNAGSAKTGAGMENLLGPEHDELYGQATEQTLKGSEGSDTFVWHKGDSGHDTVIDFTPGSDHLDLSQLLQAEQGGATSLDELLSFKVSGTGANVVSTIEVSHVGGGAHSQSIELAGVDLAQHYGVTAGAGGLIAAGHDTATIINGMLNDHSLKVDTV